MKVLVTQLYPVFCNPMDYSSPGSSVHGILQARILEWVPFPSPGDLSDPGIKPRPSEFQADSLPSEPPEKPVHVYIWMNIYIYAGSIYIFYILFHFRLLQDIEYCSYCAIQ